MTIKFLNTLSGKKEILQPLKKNKIKMYCCGVTPYGSTHIGHSRTFFAYDLLYRVLQDYGFDVEWARNITDVDDKIISKAGFEGVLCSEIVNRYVFEQNETLELFHLHRPQHEPQVTKNIPQIISLIETLVNQEYAYVSSSGVYYRVRRFCNYGKLSKNNINDLKKGVRIEVDESKEDALDFALWKFAKEDEISWDSPWGRGRPGWHVECSAMIHSLFGNSIDIHMGGRDLIFPHHEAEIAQSESATGFPLSRIWLHTGMVTLYGDKMSKSTQHYIAIKDFLKKYPAEVLRLIFLSVSYHQSINFTFETALQALKKLAKIYRFTALVDSYALQSAADDAELLDHENTFQEVIFVELEDVISKMRRHLFDDLNSSAALAVFFDLMRGVNSRLNVFEKQVKKMNEQDRQLLKIQWPTFKDWFKKVFGLTLQQPEIFFDDLKKYNIRSEISIVEIQRKIEERSQARYHKQWEKSDALRKELLGHGVQIQDSPKGTKWTLIL